jgi:DNA mismatch endonuclease (patch repair protein)
MDVHSVEQRRRNMQAIKSKGSKEEVQLAKALWSRGYRYRKNDRSIYGCPDLVFRRHRLAIFVDSEYFHGKDWETERYRIKSNRNFWWNKIEGNIKRDNLVNEVLRAEGWNVIRFWSADVRNRINNCIAIIEDKINK